MKTVGDLILEVENLKKEYHRVGFQNLTTGSLDRTGIVQNGGEWITSVGDFEGFGLTLEDAFLDLISIMENFKEFKKAFNNLEKEIKKLS